MNSTIVNPGRRRHVVCLEMLSLTAIGLLALGLAIAFPAERGESVSRRDHDVYFQSHQMFGCDPEQLSESELNDVLDWCRCLQLMTRHQISGARSLSDEECQFVLEVLDELHPDREELPSFGLIYESCAQSLAHRRPATVSRREPHSP